MVISCSSIDSFEFISLFFSCKVVHRWVPNHPDSRQRSHVDRVILLLQVEDKYVPIAESAVELVSYGGGGESSTSEGRPSWAFIEYFSVLFAILQKKKASISLYLSLYLSLGYWLLLLFIPFVGLKCWWRGRKKKNKRQAVFFYFRLVKTVLKQQKNPCK